MKAFLPAVLAVTLFLPSAFAGRGSLFVNGGYGCAPRYYAPPVCYAPRAVTCYSAPVYYRAAPVCYDSAAPVIFAPRCAPVYRAPIINRGVQISTVSFGWRR